jgi:predicted N-acyltransferase
MHTGMNGQRATASILETRYRVRLVGRVADVPATDWPTLRGAETSLFMDPRFLFTVEVTFPDARCRHALVYDRRRQLCGWASLSAFPVDLATLAGRGARWAFHRARAVRPGFGRLRAVFVGLPVSLGQSHLAMARDADARAVFAALDEACTQIARHERASLIVWKEFDPEAAGRLRPLLARGYRRAEYPAMHELRARVADATTYRAALEAHYRNDVGRAERKLRAAGLRMIQLRDPDAILRGYTPDVHRLYESSVLRAPVKPDLLPFQFFRRLVQEFPGLVSLTAVYDGDRIVAFHSGLRDGRVHRHLLSGIDGAVARDDDLYASLMYHEVDAALRAGCHRIELGQTTDLVKARLGCRSTPRYVYVKASTPLARAALQCGFSMLFPRRPPVPIQEIDREAAP